MIRRLRRRHLRMALFLALVTPVILALGLAARRPSPRQDIPATLLPP
ncbi:MAG TPA: hypothetical protein VF187_00500 [Gemmatimonadales bacterium]